jgi:hypothetical protein
VQGDVDRHRPQWRVTPARSFGREPSGLPQRRRVGVCESALAAAVLAARLAVLLLSVLLAADAALRPVCPVFLAISLLTSFRAQLPAGTNWWCHAGVTPHTTTNVCALKTPALQGRVFAIPTDVCPPGHCINRP